MRIGFDIDNVQYDFIGAVRAEWGDQYPQMRNVEPTQWQMRHDWGLTESTWRDIVNDVERRGIYAQDGRRMTWGADAVEWAWVKGHEVHLVTSRPKTAAEQTLRWIDQSVMPLERFTGIHFTSHGEKRLLDLDVLVDDTLDEVVAFVGAASGRFGVVPARAWNHPPSKADSLEFHSANGSGGYYRISDEALIDALEAVEVRLKRTVPAAALDPRVDILDEAKRLVTSDRNVTHGAPEDNFAGIAALWAPYINRLTDDGREIDALDVAIMMTLFKVGRMMNNRHNRDNFADTLGYMACGWRISELMEGNA